MSLDRKKKKEIAGLLLKGWTYEEIHKTLGFSFDDIDVVSRDIWTKESIKFNFTKTQLTMDPPLIVPYENASFEKLVFHGRGFFDVAK